MSKLFVVGIGPGRFEGMTMAAARALEMSDVIVGYTVYVDLIREHFPDKTFLTTPMRREVERVEMALPEAARGRTVAMVCSGDAGVYGMSGLCEELAARYPSVRVDTVPGVSAPWRGAALLGAPLMHDFAVVSLSDLMTPWAAIEKRLRAAAAADFVLCLYNPSSHKRKDYLARACDIILESAAPETVCGVAQNIGREGENVRILTLKELRDTAVDMFSTVFVGNSQTKVVGGKMVTPRGYDHE